MTSLSTGAFQPIKVVDIELSKPIVAVENLDGYIALKALVHLHGTPLGYIQLGVTHGRCTAAALKKAIVICHGWAIVRHLLHDGLAALPKPLGLRIADLPNMEHPQYSGPHPSVTVAICTRDRIDDLAICLEALRQLDYPNLEILVVDNAPSTDEAEYLVRTTYPNINYVRESRAGLSWARNRAIKEAQGEVIAFTDDDVVVGAGWVQALSQVFAENPEVMVVTGLVVPYELETEAQILFECHGGFGRGFDRQWYNVDRDNCPNVDFHCGAGRFGTGANMAYRRRLFDRIGLFKPSLGAGTVAKGGEDIEMFFRALNTGHTLVYEPSAFVYHRHRRDYAGLRRQIMNNGNGLSAYHIGCALAFPAQRYKFLKLHLFWLWKWHLKRLLRSLTRPHRFPRDLILAELWGYLIGPITYLRAQRAAAQLARESGYSTPIRSVDSRAQRPRAQKDHCLLPS